MPAAWQRRTSHLTKKMTALDTSVPELTKQIDILQRRGAKLEREVERLKRTPYWKARWIVGRTLRKVRTAARRQRV